MVELTLFDDQVEQGSKELMLKAMQTRSEDKDNAKNVPVSSWNHSEEYKTMKSKFCNISVTNDHTETGVALVQA